MSNIVRWMERHEFRAGIIIIIIIALILGVTVGPLWAGRVAGLLLVGYLLSRVFT